MSPKKITRRTLLALAGAAIAAGMATSPARASQPLRVILPVGPGSGVDVIARSAQQALSKALGGQAVVIENLPGAGGMIGTQALVESKPDGNTIAFVSNNHAFNPSVYKKLPYDSLADITPISIVGGSPFVFVVNNKVPAKDAKELQTLIQSKPGNFNYGSSGNGTIIHLAGEMFMQEAGVQARHIPYKGMGPMITDIMSGQIEMGASALAAVQGQLKAGTLRAIGVMGKERVKSLPDLPTIAEQGLPGVDVAGWFAVVGPKGLPPEQLERLHDAVVAAFNDPEVKAGFAARDDFLLLTTPEDASKYFASEQERYTRLVSKAKVSLD